MSDQRPFSQACENNKDVILSILKSAFAPSKKVLEIGSGTGQHAVYFAANLPHLKWQPTELEFALPTLQPWLSSYLGSNLLNSTGFDVSDTNAWRLAAEEGFDAAFSANTAHIMPWETTQAMIEGCAKALLTDGVFALYGPFNYGGKYTSESNASFDLWLKERGPHQGIRDFEKVTELASRHGLSLICDHAMPANNRLLVWKKLAQLQAV